MPNYEPQFDEMFFAILNHVGGIDKFLDTIFFFLYRRTDFFKTKKSDSDKLGLPPGMAQKMVKMICQRYVQLEKAQHSSTTDSEPSRAKEGAKTVGGKLSQQQQETDGGAKVKPSVQQEVKKDNEEKTPQQQQQQQQQEAKGEVDFAPQEFDVSKEGEIPKDQEKEAVAADPEQRYYESNPECYNGASYEKYSWAQDIYELDVQVKVSKNIKSGDQVKVVIKRKHLTVEALQDGSWEVILDGDLLYEIKLEGSTWTLHPGDHVHVQLVKGYERYWESLLEGEPKINVRQIDCSKPYEDLDQEAQAKLQEMMFDQHQKILGKPTSKQLKVQEILKQAWDKKNSPFKGQKFDPSLFNVAE